jgi:hypothetical protein
MFVTDIEISQYIYDSDKSLHRANVCMTLKDRVISLVCQLRLPADKPQSARMAALVKDAVRQLNRMPELRSGRTKLEFADDLMMPAA